MGEIKRRWYINYIIIGLFIISAYIIIPAITNNYTIRVINVSLIYYVACLGIAIILGMGGQVSFATITFMGLGSYFSANFAIHLGWDSLLAATVSIILTTLVATIIGMILLRLKGTFFTFSTVALVQISYGIFANWRGFTGGPDGIPNVHSFSIGSIESRSLVHDFYIIATICVICSIIVSRIRKTNLGRALSSVRDDEIAASVMGINEYKIKVIAFALSAAFAAMSGSMMVFYTHFVGSSSFTFDQSATFVIMAMLGGVQSTGGVFFGSVLITILPEVLKPLQRFIRLFYGLGVVFLMIFMPMGLAGLFQSVLTQVKEKFHLVHKTLVGIPPGKEGN